MKIGFGYTGARRKLYAATALSLASMILLPRVAAAAGALPTGGSYVAGQGTIGGAGSTLTVQQSSKTGIINWSSFSIGEGLGVRFENGAGSTLNRVTGGDLSRIAGTLSASGSLYLINPQGVVISSAGRVVTGGSFVASSRDVTDAAFLSEGGLKFTGTSTGSVTNAGSIEAGGDAVLIGSGVVNTGSMRAAGLAGLAAGEDVLLSRVGDQHLFVKAGVGDVNTSGTVSAASAELKAAGGNVYALAGNAGGLVNATGTRTVGGHVWLTSTNGTLTVNGTVTAAGAPGSPGFIETSGHAVSLGGARIDAGRGGQWLVDPYDLTIDATTATTINTSLGAGTNVSLQTTDTTATGPGIVNAAGNGDIIVNGALAWNTSATLFLTAWRNVNINANITIGGGGRLALTTATGGGGGAYIVAPGYAVTFTGGSASGARFSVNGSDYTLIYSLGALQALNASTANLGKNYALAVSLDALTDPTTPATWVPIGTGAKSTLLNLNKGFTGIFDGLGNTISNISLDQGQYNYSGVFGFSSGTVRELGVLGGAWNATQYVGPVVAYNTGTVIYDWATSPVGGTLAGDLVGAANVGGLVGYNKGLVTRSYATGTGFGRLAVAGLVGYNFNTGTVSESYATGNANAGHYAAGLVGWNDGGLVTDSYATGDVVGYASSSYGGLVAMNRGTVNNGYSTGTITLLNGVVSTQARSYVGSNYGPGSLFTGAVLNNGYWDTQTSGITSQGPITAVGYSPNITGLTTAQLQGSLPSGLSSALWGTGAGLYPYLLWQIPSNTTAPKAISGTAYSDLGTTVLKSTRISVTIDGVLRNSIATGANGYYYALETPATILSGGSAVLVASAGTTPGAAYSLISGQTTGLTVWGGAFRINPSFSTWSGVAGAVTSALGGSASLTSTVGGLNWLIANNAGGFTFDTPVTLAHGVSVQTVGAANGITVNGALTLTGTSGLSLTSGKDIAINSAIAFTGGGALSLTTGSGADYGFGQSGGVSFSGGSGSGASLKINGASYTLLYSLADVQAINASAASLLGRYALATSLNAATDLTTPAVWTPIGTDGLGHIGRASRTGFAGVFAGLGNTIANLNIDIGTNNYAGLFGSSRGVLRDFGLTNATVNGSGNVGAVVGSLDAAGTLSKVYATGTVTGDFNVGGLVGLGNGAVTKSYSGATVSGGSAVGGLVGSNRGSLQAAYATGAVFGGSSVGGLAGYNSGTVANAYATGSVSGGDDTVGGLIGLNAGTLTSAYAIGAVNGGGLIGVNSGSVTSGYWDTVTTGQSASDGGTGLTTSAFQTGVLPSGFSALTWGASIGAYPALLWTLQ